MRIGASHKWQYHTEKWNETKHSPRTWTFTYTQTKKRKGKHAPKKSGMPIGSKLHWRIRADQYAIKTGPNTYKLIMKGTKYRQRHSTNRNKPLRR